jgi:hypothetical protein
MPSIHSLPIDQGWQRQGESASAAGMPWCAIVWAAALQAVLLGASETGREGGSGSGHAAVLLGAQCLLSGGAEEQQQAFCKVVRVVLLRCIGETAGAGGGGMIHI